VNAFSDANATFEHDLEPALLGIAGDMLCRPEHWAAGFTVNGQVPENSRGDHAFDKPKLLCYVFAKHNAFIAISWACSLHAFAQGRDFFSCRWTLAGHLVGHVW
jgi:hypothetical protein